MKVAVHNIHAECPACRGTDFQALGNGEQLAAQTPMRCTGCGATTEYVQLIMQIADKALTRSTQMLRQMREQRLRIRDKIRKRDKRKSETGA